MTLEQAIESMMQGKKVKLSEWEGYWFIPDNLVFPEGTEPRKMVRVLTKKGDILTTPWFDDYTSRLDFEVTEGKLDFGFALRALKNGKRVRRPGWNGNGILLIMFRGSDIAKNMGYGFGEVVSEFTFTDVIGIKTAQNEMVLGWKPTTPDMLASDWEIIFE